MKIPDETLAILSGSVEGERNLLRIVRQLDTKTYRKVNTVLEALGGTWNKKVKAHVFPMDTVASDVVDLAILAGEVTTAKDLGFFPTPPELAEHLCELAEVRPVDYCLEPEAGEGAIVDALVRRKALVHAIEYDMGRFEKLVTKYEATPHEPAPKGNQRRCFISRSGYVRIERDDFMNVPLVTPAWECVVMNPMFMRSGLGDHLHHVLHAYNGLAKGGILVSVLPVSIEFRQDKRHTAFREWYQGCRFQLDHLPDGSFKSSGTNVRTVTLKLWK